VSIVTLMLALTGKLMIKDRLTRKGPAGFARRGEHMGVGLVGRTFGSASAISAPSSSACCGLSG
jgi:hypothetical protein